MGLELGWGSGKQKHQREQFLFVLVTLNISKNMVKLHNFFLEHGYTSVSLDWRGHGLADRLTSNPLLGHVETFSDYLKDFDAVIDWAKNFNLPKPWFVLGHSMGGAILLRNLHENKHFNAAVFSCPMWGIKLNPALRIFAYIYGNLARFLKLDKNFAPTRSEKGYFDESFEKNALTNDPDMWCYLIKQITEQPSLKLGGPSVKVGQLRVERNIQIIKATKSQNSLYYFLG